MLQSEALARLLAHESRVSDLLAWLIEIDDSPIREYLGLGSGPVRARREVGVKGGSIDLVLQLHEDGRPVAVLEMKTSADIHGDQLGRYDGWVESLEQLPRRFLCTLDGDRLAPLSWTCVSLSELFAAFAIGSSNEHGRWLAGEISNVLHLWDSEADGRIGIARGRSSPDVFTRRVAENLRLSEDPPDSSAGAWRTTRGGNAMFMFWAPHPCGKHGTWLGVNVRENARRGSGGPWSFRPCIEVEAVEGRTVYEARVIAHELMMELAERVTCTHIQRGLVAADLGELAEALSTKKRHDGFAREYCRTEARRARVEIENGERSHYSAFLHDRGRRLALLFQLDMTMVDRRQVEALCRFTLKYMLREALVSTGGSGKIDCQDE
ncbi:hypothetical protein C8E95_1772 [Pseudonocardia autotrophica]|uniref:PD-(D/E)XK nuclease superfamily protein n=3 Tax=Pseudonocardiaceae TaxID=2070 RepID=A0A1Y2MWM3_PSEAH|nr:hypothetical protein BG845_03176 [Pseudonocardia autotrophica]TDN72711.1 hypothetical protein C8E95_1772 [Pseudonocardia autotrophica]